MACCPSHFKQCSWLTFINTGSILPWWCTCQETQEILVVLSVASFITSCLPRVNTGPWHSAKNLFLFLNFLCDKRTTKLNSVETISWNDRTKLSSVDLIHSGTYRVGSTPRFAIKMVYSKKKCSFPPGDQLRFVFNTLHKLPSPKQGGVVSKSIYLDPSMSPQNDITLTFACTKTMMNLKSPCSPWWDP